MELLDLAGLANDRRNFWWNLESNVVNFIHGIKREELEDKRYDEQMEYLKQMDAQGQKNFEAQMAFQKAQSDMQQQQFAANRIGNLTKEYKETGLNPALAAGMGASTAGIVGTGGTATRGTAPSKEAHIMARAQEAEMKSQNMIALAQIRQNGEMTDAQVKKMEAEINLINAQAQTERMKPELIKAQTENFIQQAKLTEEHIKSMSYENIEKQIVAQFIAEHPEMKEKEVRDKLEEQGLKNKLTKAQTAREKAEIVFGAVRTIIYGISAGASIMAGGQFATPIIQGFHM